MKGRDMFEISEELLDELLTYFEKSLTAVSNDEIWETLDMQRPLFEKLQDIRDHSHQTDD